MYFWQIRRLREDLAAGVVSERHAFYYYLGTALLGALLYEAVANGPPSEGSAGDVLDGAMYIGSVVVGLVRRYRQNGGAAGREFLQRIVPVAWVMWWRLVAVAAVFFVAVGVYQWLTTGTPGRTEAPAVVILMNLLYLGMYWRTGVHMRWVADHAGNGHAVTPSGPIDRS